MYDGGNCVHSVTRASFGPSDHILLLDVFGEKVMGDVPWRWTSISTLCMFMFE